MNIDFSQFLNMYDIMFIIVCLISIFFGIKNGLVKSIFNLFKWVLIFLLIKNCFIVLRPLVDPYVTNQTIADILIFLFTIITSYIFISFVNRLIIGIIQPKKSGLIDIGFGAALGIVRGYIVFVIIIFFINTNFSLNSLPSFINEGTFKTIVDYGAKRLNNMPRDIEDLNKLGN